MLFHSQVFLLIFFPITISLYYAFARHAAAREWFLIAASIVFYAWWDVRFLPLLLTQTLGAWLLAKLSFATGRRVLLWLAIALNLGVLALFKYADFFAESLELALGQNLPRADLLLPIGISFYTFQIVSYLADALGGKTETYSLRRFSLFVMLFPQLVAGPIVRHNEIISQFDFDPLRPGVAERLARGLSLFILALAAKVMIADRLAMAVDPVFSATVNTVPTMATAWAATVGFGMQIFFDFAAYSEMAIGIALMMGLTLPMNFRQPYRAASLTDFWRRWHMTLSRFLRDYLYIPLGGSRHGAWRYMVATLTTMGLCGLWHGAGWTFILWGFAHGVGLVTHRAWRGAGLAMPAPFGWLLTFAFVIVLFGLFRAPDFASATHLGLGLFGAGGVGTMPEARDLALIGVAMVLALQPFSGIEIVRDWLPPYRAVAIFLAVLAAYIVLEVGKGQPQTFIYFQF